ASVAGQTSAERQIRVLHIQEHVFVESAQLFKYVPSHREGSSGNCCDILGLIHGIARLSQTSTERQPGQMNTIATGVDSGWIITHQNLTGHQSTRSARGAGGARTANPFFLCSKVNGPILTLHIGQPGRLSRRRSRIIGPGAALKSLNERVKPPRGHYGIRIQKCYVLTGRMPGAKIIASAKSDIGAGVNDSQVAESLFDSLSAAITGGIIDYNDFDIWSTISYYGLQALQHGLATVVIDHNDGR